MIHHKPYLMPRLLGLALAACAMAASAADQPQRPNILLIVADDLGYSDIGAFGGEIATPNLDALVQDGVALTDFYASPFCSPTRAMLMSGADNHQVGFGSMAELLTPQQRSLPGYEGYLSDRALPFPVVLQDAGYRTYMTGKWHLGVKEEFSPPQRGFDQSYALMHGGASHYDQSGIITFDADKAPVALYRENGKEVQLPDSFYSSEFFASRLLSYIDADQRKDQPFFAYLAFTAPHWPLQAPDEYISKYEGRYDAGYDVLREERLARMKKLGLVPQDMQGYVGNPAWPRWKDLSPEQQRVESRRMAVYAAMVEAMDAQIGRVIDHLKQTGQYDNTVVIFMSDNGADGNTVLDEGATRAWAHKHRDNSYENTGRPGSFVEYGPGWAQLGSTPFNLYKAFMYEGGISVPSIVRLPGGKRQGEFVRAPAHVTDVAPTILALAQVEQPGEQYRGRDIVPMQGRSMVDMLAGRSDSVHDTFRQGWELNGRRAMRVGDWKIVYANAPWGKDRWELFNIAADRAELKDLAAEHPDKLKEMISEYEQYANRNGVMDFEGLASRPGYSNSLNYYKDLDESL